MQAARGASLNTGDDETPTPGTAPARRPRRLLWFLAVAAVIYAVDVLTKVWAVRSLQGREPIEVIPGVLDLRFLRNGGAAFGMGTGMTWLLSVVACAVVVAVAVMAPRLRDRGWAVGLGLLLAGALGNLTDRFFREPGFLHGHVVDFLELPNWPVFNVADMSLTAACVLIVVQSFRGVGIDGEREGAQQTSAGEDSAREGATQTPATPADEAEPRDPDETGA
jgi:signal peptidase II